MSDTYTVSPQDSQDSVTDMLRAKFPLIPFIPDGLPEGEHSEIKLNADGSVRPFVVIWFHAARRTKSGRSFSTTRLASRRTGCDIVAVANSGSEARRILNGVSDFLVDKKPVRSGRITDSDAPLWENARPMDMANRPARFLATSTFTWGMNNQKIA